MGDAASHHATLGFTTGEATYDLTLDLMSWPFTPIMTVAPGETWLFQVAYRDTSPDPIVGGTFNLTEGVRATIE